MTYNDYTILLYWCKPKLEWVTRIVRRIPGGPGKLIGSLLELINKLSHKRTVGQTMNDMSKCVSVVM